MTKRKPLPGPRRCPACGSRVEMGMAYEHYAYVACDKEMCGVYGPSRKGVRAAILAWNRMIEKPKGGVTR